MHSEALKPKDGFTYHSTENACVKNPCLLHQSCQNGFTDKGYRCVGKELPNSTPNEPKTSTNPIELPSTTPHKADTSTKMNVLPPTVSSTAASPTIVVGKLKTDINKCTNDSKVCGVNARCIKTDRSYGCTCKEGVTRAGGFCSDDECRTIIFQTPIHNKVIEGNVIRTEEVSHQGSCNEMCYMEPSCVSMNFGPKVGGNFTCELNQDHPSKGDHSPPVPQSKNGHIYLAIENPCSSNPCSNNGTCQVGYTDKGFRCKCPSGFTGAHCNKACSFDFEDGIGGWEMTGTAFIHQPTFGDNPAARGRGSAQQQGDWWIGGMEYRPSKSDTAGWQNPARGDPPQGTLISPCFRIVGRDISFLIGGGCAISVIRAELIVDNQVVRNETGNCYETMYRKSWDVKEFIGQYAQVRLVDKSSGGWGHINFDDLKGDIICPHHLGENN